MINDATELEPAEVLLSAELAEVRAGNCQRCGMPEAQHSWTCMYCRRVISPGHIKTFRLHNYIDHPQAGGPCQALCICPSHSNREENNYDISAFIYLAPTPERIARVVSELDKYICQIHHAEPGEDPTDCMVPEIGRACSLLRHPRPLPPISGMG